MKSARQTSPVKRAGSAPPAVSASQQPAGGALVPISSQFAGILARVKPDELYVDSNAPDAVAFRAAAMFDK